MVKEKGQEDLEKLKDVPKARRRVLMVSPTEFAGLFTKGMFFAKKTKIAEGIPDDFKLLGTAYDLRLDAILMLGESETYDEVPMTEIPPRQMITIVQGKAYTPAKKKQYRVGRVLML